MEWIVSVIVMNAQLGKTTKKDKRIRNVMRQALSLQSLMLVAPKAIANSIAILLLRRKRDSC